MGKKYTTDTLSATQGIYGKQLFTDKGETVANILSYTETQGAIPQSVSSFQMNVYSPGILSPFVQGFGGLVLPILSVGDKFSGYNSNDGSEAVLQIDAVYVSTTTQLDVDATLISGVNSGTYLSQIGVFGVNTNIVTDVSITSVLSPNDYVILGLNYYILSAASGTNITIPSAVTNIANILSIEKSLDFAVLNYKSVLTNGVILTEPTVRVDSQSKTTIINNVRIKTNDNGDDLFIGFGAGDNISYSGDPNFPKDSNIFIGENSGANLISAAGSSLCIGKNSGANSEQSFRNIFLGESAGTGAIVANTNSIGYQAGLGAINASTCNFIGTSAGKNSTGAASSNFIGPYAGMDSSGSSVNAFGSSAGRDNALDGQTIFANTTLPSYADRAAATTAITVANGASAGDTYLYYNASTFTIQGVRL
jgi:hypothetical protein